VISRLRLPRCLLFPVLAAALNVTAAAGIAHAGAWTFPQGSGQVILNNLYYSATDEFTRGGHRRSFSDDGEFTKYEFNPYIEYGLRDDLTLVLNLFARRVAFSNNFSDDVNFGLADPEIGLRYRLSPPSAQTVWSVQATLKLPVAVPHDTPPLGNEQTDAEARLLVGRGFSIAGHWAYWDVELAYRFRDEAPADEIKLDATLGVSLSERWLAIGQFFGTRGLRNGSVIRIQGNPTIDTNYDLYKGQLSIVYQLTQSVRLQAGYVRDLAGRNTGAGQAALLAVWFRF
jgi:protein XagA